MNSTTGAERYGFELRGVPPDHGRTEQLAMIEVDVTDRHPLDDLAGRLRPWALAMLDALGGGFEQYEAVFATLDAAGDPLRPIRAERIDPDERTDQPGGEERMPDQVDRDRLTAVIGLHRLLASANRDGDLAWSPYSLLSALGLVADGARGTTRAEVLHAIGASRSPDDAARELTEAADIEGSRIAVSNTLWVNAGLPVHESYESAVRSWPGGAAEVVDFEGDPDRARRAINTAVEKTTHGIIKDLLGGNDVTSSTLSVLVNAIWLRLIWADPFDADLTRERPFHAPDRTYDTATMSKLATLPYAEAGGWRQLSLRAEGDVLCDVLLPDEPDANDLGPPTDVLAELRTRLSPTKLDLRLPRFDARWKSDLNDTLDAAGVRSLFGPDADLSGISNVPLRVDKVVHQAALQLDEEGAEGAAATAVMMTRAAFGRPEPKPVRFWVDRPFHVLLRHRPTGVLYFVARITNP